MSQTRGTKQPVQDQALPAQADQQIGHQLGLRCETFSREEAAAVIGVSTRTLDRLLAIGVLRFIPGTKRLSQQRVRAYLHDSTVDGHAA